MKALWLALLFFLSIGCARAQRESNATPGQSFWVEVVGDQLKFPWSLAWLPNGDMLVTERQGGLRRVHRDGKLEAQPIANVPAGYRGSIGLQLGGGLSDIVLDPEFAANRNIYFSLAEGTAERHHAPRTYGLTIQSNGESSERD